MLVIHLISNPRGLSIRVPVPAASPCLWAALWAFFLMMALGFIGTPSLAAGVVPSFWVRPPPVEPPISAIGRIPSSGEFIRNELDPSKKMPTAPAFGQPSSWPSHPGENSASQALKELKPLAPTLKPYQAGSGTIKLMYGEEAPTWDEKFVLPSLNTIKSYRAAQYIYDKTKKVLDEHPVQLLKRNPDGRFQTVSVLSDKNTSQQERHQEAVTDVMATATYEETQSLQARNVVEHPPGPVSTLTVNDMTKILVSLKKKEKGYNSGIPLSYWVNKFPSEPQKKGIPDVSEISVHGESPETKLDVELRPVDGQTERFIGRVNLDEVIQAINKAGFLELAQ